MLKLFCVFNFVVLDDYKNLFVTELDQITLHIISLDVHVLHGLYQAQILAMYIEL